MRTSIHKEIDYPQQFKQQLLNWSQLFREVIFLDSNTIAEKYSNFDAVLAVDAFTSIKTDCQNAFEDLRQYQQTTADWLFGYLSYDLKNDLEALQSANFDGLQFPDLFFFQPKKIFLLKGHHLEIRYLNFCQEEAESDFTEILGFEQTQFHKHAPLIIRERINKENYVSKVLTMLEHIYRGDIYEANLCMEFYAENAAIHPLEIFKKLNQISEPPFAVFLKIQNHFLLSASPERYLKKEGSTLISQPIKGTSARFTDLDKDLQSKKHLIADPKERAENIMIADLVRNDLSRTAQKGSVKVEELCGISSFLQVHQMISTVTSEFDPQYPIIESIRTTFPMGSMTGVPKISAMKIIEELEETKRGLYSGAVGYFTPEGDFDFNVVIRSILYNAENQYVSFSVGSAITALSIPEKEYEECLLKAKAMREVLN